MAVTLDIGIPVLGMVRDAPGAGMPPGMAANLVNVRRTEGELRTRPGLAPFADHVDTKPVQNLFTVELATGVKKLLRVDEDNAYLFDGSAWSEIMPPATTFSGSNVQPFSLAMCNNEVILAQGVAADKAWRWTGSGDVAQIANDGIFTNISFKYVAFYAGRVIGAYTTNATYGAVHLIGSERGSNTGWDSANAAISVVLNDTPSAITGLSANDNELIVWKERHVVTGRETGDPTNPIAFYTIRADGLGSVGHRASAGFAGSWFNLSPEGFFVLSGGTPQFIDEAIRRDFWRRVNSAALQNIHTLVIPELAQVIWFVPEGTHNYANCAWVYDINTRGWDRWEFGAKNITTATRTFVADGGFKVVDDYSTSPTDIVDTGTISGATVDSLTSNSSTPNYILGDANGRTYILADYAKDDDGTTFQFIWETGDYRWEGAIDYAASKGVGDYVTIGPNDLVTFDHLVLEYRHATVGGVTQRVQIQASVNGGLTWTNLNPVGAFMHPLTDTTDNYTTLRAFGRVTGYRIRFRISAPQVAGYPKFRTLRIVGMRAGGIR